MNRKVLVSAGIIALCVLYLFITKIWRESGAPKLSGWKGRADEILIQSKGVSLRLHQKNRKWVIGEEAYPADENKVKDVEDKAREIRLVELVSEREDFDRYELVPEKYTELIIKKGDETVRRILAGKRAQSNSHSFVKADDRPGIYLAAGSFDAFTGKTADDFRDKEIIKILRDTVESLEIQYRGKTYGFLKTKEQKKIDSPEEKDDNKPDLKEKKENEKDIWTLAGSGMAVSQAKMDPILSLFDPLRVESYPEVKKESLGNPLAMVKIKAAGKETSVMIYTKDGKGRFTAACSESPHVFTMNEWNVKKIFIENIEEFREKKQIVP